MLSFEFREIPKNTFFTEYLQKTASGKDWVVWSFVFVMSREPIQAQVTKSIYYFTFYSIKNNVKLPFSSFSTLFKNQYINHNTVTMQIKNFVILEKKSRFIHCALDF